MTEAQRAIVTAKANAARIPVNQFMVAAALGSDYCPPTDPYLVRALLALNRELTAQGNNLNQIAYRLNADLATPGSALDQLAVSLRQTHRQVRQALRHGQPNMDGRE